MSHPTVASPAVPADMPPVAIVNGVPTDQFGKPYLTRPPEFEQMIEAKKAEAKAKALAEARHRIEHPELFEEDSPSDYTVEERKARQKLRDESSRISDELWCLNGHLRWLNTWQDGRYLAHRMRELNAKINELIEYRRHLIDRYFDREHTKETVDTIDRKERRRKAITKALRGSHKSAKTEKKTEKKLGGLSAEQVELLMKNTGLNREQLAGLVGK